MKTSSRVALVVAVTVISLCVMYLVISRTQSNPAPKAVQRAADPDPENSRKIAELIRENRLLQEKIASGVEGKAISATSEKVQRLKDFFAALPEQQIPELRFATAADWEDAVVGNLDSVDDYRRAMASVRFAAQRKFAGMVFPALQNYLGANQGQFPTAVTDLGQFLDSSIDPTILARYKKVPASEIENVKVGGDWVITQSVNIDPDYDGNVVIGPGGHGYFSAIARDAESVDARRNRDIIGPVLGAYASANGGKSTTSIDELLPYARNQEQRDALRFLHDRMKKH